MERTRKPKKKVGKYDAISIRKYLRQCYQKWNATCPWGMEMRFTEYLYENKYFLAVHGFKYDLQTKKIIEL